MLEKKKRNLLYFSFFEFFCFFPFIFCFNVLSTHMTLNVHFLSHVNGISMNCSVLCVQIIYFSLKFHKHVKFCPQWRPCTIKTSISLKWRWNLKHRSFHLNDLEWEIINWKWFSFFFQRRSDTRSAFTTIKIGL